MEQIQQDTTNDAIIEQLNKSPVHSSIQIDSPKASSKANITIENKDDEVNMVIVEENKSEEVVLPPISIEIQNEQVTPTISFEKPAPATESPLKNGSIDHSKIDVTSQAQKLKEEDDKKIDVSSQAQKLKEQGTNYFKKGEFGQAFIEFNDAYEILKPYLKDKSSDIFTLNKELLINILNNLSVCSIKLNNLQGCIDWANTAIIYDPNNAKAYLRKGMAHKKLGSLNEALIFFQMSEQYGPSEDTRSVINDVKKEISNLNKEEKPTQEQKEMFQKMFQQKQIKKPEEEVLKPNKTTLRDRLKILAVLPGFVVIPILLRAGVARNPSISAGVLSGGSLYLSTLVYPKWLKVSLIGLSVVIAAGVLKFKNALKF